MSIHLDVAPLDPGVLFMVPMALVVLADFLLFAIVNLTYHRLDFVLEYVQGEGVRNAQLYTDLIKRRLSLFSETKASAGFADVHELTD